MPLFGRKKQNSPPSAKKADPKQSRILGINWLGIKSTDVVGAAIFMERTLGLNVSTEGNSNLGHHVRYNCGPIELELLEGAVTWALQPKPRHGAPDIPLIPSFVVDDIQPIATLLQEKEIPATQVFDQGWASNMLFFDPERHLWQVAQINNVPPVGTNSLSYLGVLWLAVEDLEAQVKFYQEVLGLPLTDRGGTERPVTERAEKEFQNVAENEDNNKVETATLEQSPMPDMGAVFFEEGARLALTSGGKRLEDGAARVWGKDTAFQLGFRAINLKALAQHLTEHKVPISGPYGDNKSGYWLHFTDPEGNTWRVTEPLSAKY